MKVGRKNVYDSKIKPKFEYIKAQLGKGASEKQVAKAIGVGYSTWLNYKATNQEFSEFLKNDVDRSELVDDLRSALIKKALGFSYEEKKVTVQEIQLEDGETKIPAKVIRTETMTKFSPPDVASINLALKNYDKENWSNDWQAYDLKKEELELKKKLAEEKIWNE